MEMIKIKYKRFLASKEKNGKTIKLPTLEKDFLKIKVIS